MNLKWFVIVKMSNPNFFPAMYSYMAKGSLMLLSRLVYDKRHLLEKTPSFFCIVLELRKSAKSSRTESMKSLEKKRESRNRLERKESQIRSEIANDNAIKEITLHDSIYRTNNNEDDSDVIIEITDDDSENDGEKTHLKNKDDNLSESEEVDTKEVNDKIDVNERVSSVKESGKMEDEVINQREDSTFCLKDDSVCEQGDITSEQGDITTKEVNQLVNSISNSVIDLKYEQDAKDESKQGQISSENEEKTETEEESDELTDPVNGRKINGISEDNNVITDDTAVVLPKVEERSKGLQDSAGEQFLKCLKVSESKDEKENSEHKEISNTDLPVTKNEIENERIIDGIQSEPLTVLNQSNVSINNSDIYENTFKTLHPETSSGTGARSEIPSCTGAHEVSKSEDEEISAFVRDIFKKILDDVDKHSVKVTSKEFQSVTKDGHGIKTTVGVNNDAMASKISKDNDQTKHDIEFIKCNLTPKRKVPIVCNICSSEDHYYKECPIVKRDYKPLKEPTKEWLSQVERVCSIVLRKHELTGEEFQKRLRAVKDIEKHLRKKFSSE